MMVFGCFWEFLYLKPLKGGATGQSDSQSEREKSSYPGAADEWAEVMACASGPRPRNQVAQLFETSMPTYSYL